MLERRHITMILCLAIILSVLHIYAATPSNSKRHNGDLHKGNQYIDTLSWAVVISDNETTPSFQSGATVIDYLSRLLRLIQDEEVHTALPDIDKNTFASIVAKELGLVNQGQIGRFTDHYLFEHHYHNKALDVLHKLQDNEQSGFTIPKYKEFKKYLDRIHGIADKDWSQTCNDIEEQLEKHPKILLFSRQTFRSRQKRDVIQPVKLHFDDPAYRKQWHLKNNDYRGYDINVTGVWEYGVTGKGITAVVVDDGLEWTNPDLVGNYRADGSYDLNDKDHDPMPSSDKPKNHHGTRCAGEIAAVKNSVCAVGVAYEAGISGLRVLDGPMTDQLESDAFTNKLEVNDIFSCSWGPDDDGKTVDGPHYYATRGLQHGVDYGRGGYGAVYVVASGNGGSQGDNCNFDGYANSVYTLTIGAVDERNEMPYYSEQCASMLAVTYSSGNGYTKNIVTTDWLRHGATGCTEDHTGTSAAAPLAAGMITLMLSARPCLSWRDVQYIVIMAATKVDVDVAHWHKNAAGLHHSHRHGFGLMDAWKLVNAAKAWESVPWPTTFTSEILREDRPITRQLQLTYTVSEPRLAGYDLFTLEYIQVTVTLTHFRRGDIEIRLRCPSGTESIMAATRPHDNSTEGFREWTFSTVRCWGEEPLGTYVLLVADKGVTVNYGSGVFETWRLKLYGTPMTTEDIQKRMRLVKDAASGHYLRENVTLPCPPPPVRPPPFTPISYRILKILFLTGGFCIFLAVYETFEYLFCYDDEKKLHRRLMKLSQRARQLTNPSASSNPQQEPEAEALLNNDQSEEVIEMEDLNPTNESRDDSEESQRLVGLSEVGHQAQEEEGEQCQRIAQKFTEGLSGEGNDKKSESDDSETSDSDQEVETTSHLLSR